MVGRQPEHARVVGGAPEGSLDGVGRDHQLGVRHERAARPARRARRVLDQRQAARADGGRLPGIGPGGVVLLGLEPRQVGQAETIATGGATDGEPRPRVASQRFDGTTRATGPDRIRGHDDGAGQQACEDRDDVVEPWRQQDEHPLVGGARVDQSGRQAPRAAVELGVGQVRGLVLAVEQERIRDPVRLVRATPRKQVDERGWAATAAG